MALGGPRRTRTQATLPHSRYHIPGSMHSVRRARAAAPGAHDRRTWGRQPDSTLVIPPAPRPRGDRARALVDRGPAGPAATRRGARHARLLALRAGGQRRRPCCQLRLQVAPARKEGHSRPAEGKGDRDGEPSHAKGARSAAAHLAIPISRVLLVRGARHAGGAAVLSAQHGAHT